MRPFIAAAALLLIALPSAAQASTTMEYPSPCRYIDAQDTLQVATTCNVNFGTLSAAGGARYIVTFPNQSKITVYIQTDGTVTTNGIKSQAATAGGNVVIATAEGEIFTFKAYRR